MPALDACPWVLAWVLGLGTLGIMPKSIAASTTATRVAARNASDGSRCTDVAQSARPVNTHCVCRLRAPNAMHASPTPRRGGDAVQRTLARSHPLTILLSSFMMNRSGWIETCLHTCGFLVAQTV
eukprot:6211990-Pleurochrysis_carterae.AAC.1